MRGLIDVPVGTVIRVYGSEIVCVEDYKDKYGEDVSCRACPVKDTDACWSLCCTCGSRTDFKDVHFEYYYERYKKQVQTNKN